MTFPHESYRAAVHQAREDSLLDVEADILDFKEDGKKHGLLYMKLRFRGRVDTTDFAEGGTAVQRDSLRKETFISSIVTFDESTGEIVVEVNGQSPSTRPEPGFPLFLNPPDYLQALDEFASQISGRPALNPETRFVHLAEELLPSKTDSARKLNNEHLRPSQSDAVGAALQNPFVFLWGPPGTGKSYTLGHLAAEWRKAGKKILVIAHTNAAVDVTTFAIDNACAARGEKLADAELIRYTRVLSNVHEYRRRPHLLAFTRLLSSLLDEEDSLRRRSAALKQELANCRADGGRREEISLAIAKCEKSIASLGDRRKSEIAKLLEGASIICASITSCLFGRLLANFRFDAVMLDEASLVPLAVWPWLLHPWHVGHEPQFAVAGDPMQLQPIFKRRNSSTSRHGELETWFENNLYARVGLLSLSSARPFIEKGTLVFLNVQSRMARGICEAVSRTFYNGLLTGDGVGLMPDWPADSGIPNGELVAIDPCRCVSLLSARITRNMVGRNTNADSLKVTLALVKRMIECVRSRTDGVSILVVTPFRNQAREYEKHLTALARPQNVVLRASTVHRCQGSEADVVVFDLVDAGNWFVNRPEASSLWCVACSRAKSQLFLVGGERAMRNGRFSQLMVGALPFEALS